MKEKMMESFRNIYGNQGEISLFFAPGRVNLIGEHTDYNGGHVFPCALTMGTYLAIRKREDAILNFFTENMPELGVIKADLNDLSYKKEADWTNYPKGVIWALKQRGYELASGMDIVIYGNIPNGSGLSSSASLEVVTALAIKELYGYSDLSMTDLALISQYAENNYNGCNCGIMDQFAVAMGKKDHSIFLNTNDLSFQYVPVDLPNHKIIITNSKVKHSLVDSEYNKRRAECEEALKDLQSVTDITSLGELSEAEFERHKNVIKNPVCRKRAHHAVYENQRTIQAVSELEKGNITAFGELMNESHRSLRDDYEVSCSEIDTLVELAWEIPGVLGSRITGGGFGGCTVSIVTNDVVDFFQDHVRGKYQEKTGHQAECYITQIGDGAMQL